VGAGEGGGLPVHRPGVAVSGGVDVRPKKSGNDDVPSVMY